MLENSRYIIDYWSSGDFVPQQAHGKAGDIAARGRELRITNNGVVQDLTNALVFLEIGDRQRNNMQMVQMTPVDAVNGIFRAEYPKEILQKGTLWFHYKIIVGSMAYNSLDGAIICEDNYFVDSNIVNNSNFTVIQELLNRLSNYSDFTNRVLYLENKYYINHGDIEAGTNLNNITTPGFYRCKTNDFAKTLTNCPTNTAFTMIVTSTGAGYASQRLLEHGENAREFIRNKVQSTFYPWQETPMILDRGGDYKSGYERYADGRQITWKTVVLSNQSFPNAIGTNYYSDAISLGAQPIAFINDVINVTSHVESSGVFTNVTFVSVSKSSLGNILCTRNGSNSAVSEIYIKIRCEGRWK